MEYKVENLCGFLIRSKLMAPNEMQAMRQRWQAEARDATASTAFIKWLIAKNYLTEYQATLLAKGHVDDFFLGDYKILERIGRGRMAGVYKAVHPSGQVVAIKVLPPSRARAPQMLARFQREARLSVKLKHANVVRSFQVGESRGVNYLVMEYLVGETLDDVLQRRKRLPPQEGVRLIHQALLGLQHIHEQGLVHRDLKPANLMLLNSSPDSTAKATVKILDIGLAREFFDENAPIETAEKAELTGEGVLLGTPDYLAPEQARDPRTIDIRADIYSLGCTLYHVLTGQTPFPDKNILNQMIRHSKETPRPLQDFDANLPDGLSQIVNWMMAKKPEERYPTPARAAQALDTFLMVTAEPAKPAEESPQLKKYLTWLETSQTDEPAIAAPVKAAPTPKTPMPSAKPKSNPAVPIAAIEPTEKRRKKRTGVKLPEPAPTAPAAPVLEAAPEQFDVELVDLPASAPPPAQRGRSILRDVLFFGLGAGLMLFLYGFCMFVSFLVSLIKTAE